jgi:ABC-type glycerol-3-phosphate transport system substrate-binding protein
VPLAEDNVDEMLFSKNSFEAKQNRAAGSNFSNLLLFGADWELYIEFIRGKINCIYPKGGKTIINHNLYKKALEVFYKLYKSKYGKKLLVYLCIPNGDMLNILYT